MVIHYIRQNRYSNRKGNKTMSIKENAIGGIENILKQARKETRRSEITRYYTQLCGYMKCIMDCGLMNEIEVGEILVHINNEFTEIRKGVE